MGIKMGLILIELYFLYWINDDVILIKFIIIFYVKKDEEFIWLKDENYNFLFINFRLEEKF